MKTLATLLSYLFGAALLAGGLAGAVFWIVQPDSTIVHEAKAAPIPPRIAESIERKKALVAASVPAPVPNSTPAPLMTESNVALVQPPAPKFTIRELSAAPAVERRKRKPANLRSMTASSETRSEISSSNRTVSTARSDFPY